MNKNIYWIESEKCFSNDIVRFQEKLKTALGNEWDYEELGTVEKYPLPLITGKKKKENGKNILIAAGFHGEETAGVWAVLKFLASKPKIDEKINLAFLPLVNPTGFAVGQRVDYAGGNPNRGYCHEEKKSIGLSEEGVILTENIDKILLLSKEGFLSLHEDTEQKKSFFYTFEKTDKPSDFSYNLKNSVQGIVSVFGSGIVKDRSGIREDDASVVDGICFNKHDGSFEDFLFDSGVGKTACSETPGSDKIDKRIAANLAIMKSFINYFGEK